MAPEFTPCCDVMAARLDPPCHMHEGWQDCPDVTLHRFADGRIGLPVHDGFPPNTAETMEVISYCPWCGTQLPQPGSGRVLWMPD